MDLVAINIQRGREHGIPDYNSVRVLCGLPRANSFEDLVNDMEANVLHIKQILALLLLVGFSIFDFVLSLVSLFPFFSKVVKEGELYFHFFVALC